MAIFAGQKLRVSDLEGTGGSGYIEMASDMNTISNTTSFADSALVLDVVANARYGFEAWLNYNTNPTPGIKIGLTTPSGTTGWWCAMGPAHGAAPVAGEERKNYTDFGTVPIGTSMAVAGDDTAPTTIRLCCAPRGHFVTTTAGTFRIKIAQSTANVSDTILRAGSWLNLVRLA